MVTTSDDQPMNGRSGLIWCGWTTLVLGWLTAGHVQWQAGLGAPSSLGLLVIRRKERLIDTGVGKRRGGGSWMVHRSRKVGGLSSACFAREGRSSTAPFGMILVGIRGSNGWASSGSSRRR